ncbi:hypothetical protein [Subtercola boreus]|uniref:hypothetical protein n=1 Tax=Subtercola boreus TaxID=120213 RepID=UPI001559E88C|nr:hypothetical protein [Subtercola boreus]
MTQPTGDSVEVRDNPGSQRYEAWFRGEIAGYIRTHPEFLDLVPGPVQKRLDL